MITDNAIKRPSCDAVWIVAGYGEVLIDAQDADRQGFSLLYQHYPTYLQRNPEDPEGPPVYGGECLLDFYI